MRNSIFLSILFLLVACKPYEQIVCSNDTILIRQVDSIRLSDTLYLEDTALVNDFFRCNEYGYIVEMERDSIKQAFELWKGKAVKTVVKWQVKEVEKKVQSEPIIKEVKVNIYKIHPITYLAFGLCFAFMVSFIVLFLLFKKLANEK